MLLILSSLLIVTLSTFWWYLNHPYSYWKLQGIPGPEPCGFIGHIPSIWTLKRNVGYDFQAIYEKFRQYPFVGLFVLRQPQILAIDTEIIKMVLVKNFRNFRDNYFSDPVDKHSDPILGRNPFNLKGEEWREKRAHLTPGFTTSRILGQYPLIQDVCRKLTTYLNNRIGNSPHTTIMVKELFNRYTCEVVSSAIFGVDAQCFTNPNSVMYENAKNFVSPKFYYLYLQLMSFFPFLPRIYKSSYVNKSVEQFFQRITQEAIQMRESHKERRNDYLDHLIQLKQNKKLSNIDLAAYGATFFLDGYETSAIFFSLVIFYLAKYEEYQERVRREVNEAIMQNNGNLTYKIVEELPFLEQMVNETLRLHAIVPVLVKLCTKDIQLPLSEDKLVTIEKGTVVNIPIYAIQRDATYYPEPEKFDPERFNKDNGGTKAYREKGIYMPFGDGPRICLGMRFALAQVKRGIVEIVKNFKLKLNHKTEEPLVWNAKAFLNISLPNDIWVDFTKI